MKKKYLSLISFVALPVLAACVTEMTPQQLYKSGKPFTESMYKAGSSASQRESDLVDCRIEAAGRVPQNVQVSTTPAYTTPTYTTCNRIGYSVYCNTTGGQVYGGNTYSYDANADLRRLAGKQCLERKGYRSLDIPACPKGVTPESLKILNWSDGRQSKVSTRTCYIATDKVQVIGNLK